jgi:hypothetical protein
VCVCVCVCGCMFCGEMRGAARRALPEETGQALFQQNALTGVTAGTCKDRGIHIQYVTCVAGMCAVGAARKVRNFGKQ